MKHTRLLTITLFLAVLVNCSDKSPNSPSCTPLEGTIWRLETFDLDLGPLPAADDQELTLTLLGETDEGYVALAIADCNHCFGEYSVWACDSISIRVSCTEAACPPETQGRLFQSALNSSTVFELELGVLRISFINDSWRGDLVFRADTHIEEL
jgi:hypothetical protein